MRHPGFVTDATLSSDLSFLATSCTDKIVRFWDPITGNLIAVPLGNDREIIAASLSADDSRLVTAEGKTAHVYNVSTDKKPIDELVFLAQTVIGKRIDITQAVSEVDAESLRDGIKRLREKFKEEFTVVTKKIASDDHVEHLLASGTDLASPLRFRNRNGDMVANGLQLRDGDDPWSYIEGATKAGAVVHLGGISESRYANGVLLAIQMKVIRHPFQAIKEPSISITLKTKNAKLIVPLDARLSPTDEARFHIHRTITAYAEGKPRVEVEVDLFDDLIDNGELSLEISGRNSLTLYGLQPSGISLHSLPVVRVREPPSQALPKIEGMRAQSAYTRVLLQIEKTCLEYDKAVFKYLDRDQEKLGVFLEDELRLHLEFADVSNAAQTALNTVSLSEQTAEIWFQKGIIHWIQGETDEAQSCFEQVIKLDKTGFPGAYLALGWSDYAKAQLERASLHMSKVLELDPENPYAFVLLQDISVLLDADFKLKTKASVKQLTQARSMLEGRSALRTLPWRGILPLDKRLEQLIKIENRAPPTSFGF
jgi:tetratricopeptide (TPR) repeat protein